MLRERMRALGRESEAQSRFDKLIRYGEQHLADHVTIDYFAVSLPEFLVFDDDLDRRHVIHCRYMMGLGHLGRGSAAEARKQLEAVLAMDASHYGAQSHLRLLDHKLW